MVVGTALRLVLLSFALIAFAGAGAAIAVIRFRSIAEGETDWGMGGVAMLLLTFAALCTALGAGWSGVVAFGGVVVWVSYLFMAQHVGLFQIEADTRTDRPLGGSATEGEVRGHRGGLR